MGESCNTTSCLLVDSPSSCDESQPLLLPSSVPNETSFRNQSSHMNFKLLKHICLPSKAAVLLICLAVVVGAVHTIFVVSSVLVVETVFVLGGHYINGSLTIITSFLAIIIAVVLFPVSGFIADVFCGRYRVMMISMCLFIISFVLMLGATTPFLACLSLSLLSLSHVKAVFYVLLVALFVFAFGIGLVIYYANFIQFGLDQLMEAPSDYLSLFVHWIMWANSLPSVILVPLIATLVCKKHFTVFITVAICCVPFVCFVSLIFLVVFSCWKRHWFYTEPGQHNPYKMVIKVLNFARKNKYPLQRSAFTYCGNERPSRLDFAKEKYGGPFTTELVEDVKTLFRILLVLLAIGPVFVLDVPNTQLTFPLIGVHIANKGHQFCDPSWIVFESGTLRYVTSAVFFPVYIWIIFSVKRPSIFTRLGAGIVLYLVSVLSILITDVIGHAQNELKVNVSMQCMLDVTVEAHTTLLDVPTLGMHWASLIITEVLLGIGPLMFVTATLEFISAQSPLRMKGLVFGLYFAIRYLFNLLGALVLLPFSLNVIWDSKQMKEHPPVTNCDFGYFSSICVIALIGLVLFSLVTKWYKNRERDDTPFDQYVVENVHSGDIERRELS